MRIDFISRLALLLVAGFLIVATQVWGGGTIEWLFIVGGIVMIALAAGALGMAPGPQRTLDALLGVLGVWSIVQAIVFEGSTLRVGVVHDRGGRARCSPQSASRSTSSRPNAWSTSSAW